MSREAAAVRAYRALLRLLPRPVRERDGEEMVVTFAAMHSASRARSARLGCVVRSFGRLPAVAVAEWWDHISAARRTRRGHRGRRTRSMDSFFQDVRFAFRNLRRSPGLVAAAVFSLAIGIGANTTIYSAIDAVRSQDLPFVEPQRLVVLWQLSRGRLGVPTYQVAAEIAEKAAAVESVGFTLFGERSVTLSDAGEPARTLPAEMIGSGLLQMLGTTPILGRVYGPEDRLDVVVQKEPRSVVIGYRLWQERFGESPDVLGQTLRIGGYERPIIGVMPAGFRVFPSGEPQVWIANDLTQVAEAAFMIPILRVRAGTDLDALQEQVNALGLNAARSFGEDVEDFAMRVETLQDVYFADTEASFLLLLGAVSLVLLIASVNVASLLLARGMERRKELTIRAALGAKRGHLVRQLLAESLLVSLAGGVLGVLLAGWGNRLVTIVAPAQFAAAVQAIAINPRVLLFSTAVCVLVAPCIGLLPALRASRIDLNDALKEGGRGAAGSRRSLSRAALLVSEVSLAMILLVGAGWMVRGYLDERYADLGFDTEGLLTAAISLRGPGYFEKLEGDMGRVSPQSTLYFERLLEEIRAMPGVEAAGTISHLPMELTGEWRVRPFERPGQEEGTSLPSAFYSEVDEGALEALGIPLLQGRYVSDQDTRDANWVAVINHSLAERYFPGENPIGQYIHVQVRAAAAGISIPEERPREIVGVVSDVKYPAIVGPAQASMYVPQSQHEWRYPGGTGQTHINKNVVIRTAFENPMRLARQVREAAATIDREQVVESVMTLESRLDASGTVVRSRFDAQLFGVFSLLALVLAMSGAYGVLSYFVAQRDREFGIRMALGASRADIMAHVFKHLLTPISVGIAIGALGGYLFTKGLSSRFVVNQTSVDPLVLAATSLFMVLVGIAAGFFPARRATRRATRSTLRLATDDE